MKQSRRILSITISIMLLMTVLSVNSISAEDGFYTVRGDVYIDDVLAPAGLDVQLYFNNVANPAPKKTDDEGHFAINWEPTGTYIGETGYFNVDYAGNTYAALDEFGTLAYVDIMPNTIGYFVDLYIYTSMPNVPPIAEANGPYTAAVGIPRTFDATGSFDPDGTITTYEWDFNGDGTFDTTTTSKTTTHTYNIANTYTITLQVTDNDGATDTDTTTATVLTSDTTPPSKVTGLTVEDKRNGKLQLTWNPATDNVEISHYKIYRDGTYLINSITTSYLDTGLVDGTTYTYQVSAVDTSNNEGEKSDNATGTPTKKTSSSGGGGFFLGSIPIADASKGEPYTGSVGESILFDGSLSSDPDGTITAWEWHFGNGVTGSGETISYSYDQPGIYTVTLTVSDNDNQIDTDETTATIIKANIPPTIPTITGPKSGTKNTAYTFTITATDEDNENLTYTLTWDDNTTNTSEPLPNGTSYIIKHSWTTAGIYEITASVSDAETATENTHTILIDTKWVKNIGYLIDSNADGIYDQFYGNTSGKTTDVEKEDGFYLIDEDGDGDWDWEYNPETDELREYQAQPTGQDIDYSIWILLLILLIILAVILYLVKRGNDKKKQKKAKEQAAKQAAAAETAKKPVDSKKPAKKSPKTKKK